MWWRISNPLWRNPMVTSGKLTHVWFSANTVRWYNHIGIRKVCKNPNKSGCIMFLLQFTYNVKIIMLLSRKRVCSAWWSINISRIYHRPVHFTSLFFIQIVIIINSISTMPRGTRLGVQYKILRDHIPFAMWNSSISQRPPSVWIMYLRSSIIAHISLFVQCILCLRTG